MIGARTLAAALALCATAAAGCGLGPRQGRGRRPSDREPGLRKQGHAAEAGLDPRVRHRPARPRPERRHHHALRRRLHPVDRRPGRLAERRAQQRLVLLRERHRVARSEPRSTTSQAATGSGGTTATGRPRCACRPWSGPGRSRSRTGSRAGAGRLSSIAARRPRSATAASKRFSPLGVQTSLGPGPGIALVVVVGPWNAVRRDETAALLAAGPDRSGVFARFVGSAQAPARAAEPAGPARREHRQGRRAGRGPAPGGRASRPGS